MRAAARRWPRSIAVPATRRHRRLSAKRDPPASRALASGPWHGGPALTAVGGSPLVALARDAPEPERACMADQPGRHGPPGRWRAHPDLGERIAGMAGRQPAEGPAP